MREIFLKNKGLWTAVDDEDYDRVSLMSWCATKKANKPGTWYVIGWGGGRREYLHRLIMDAPRGVPVDHINGDGLCNVRANLRLGTPSLNAVNRKSHSATGFKGVETAAGGRFVARIYPNGRNIYLGTFATNLDAARAYNEAAKRFYGEFAVLNQTEAA